MPLFFLKRLHGKCDRVLVDAPCSGSGTLRRNPDLKWRQSPQAVQELVVKPFEGKLWEIKGVEYLYSMSRPGMGIITVRFLVGQGADIQFVGELRHSLEDVYLQLVQNA